MQANVKRTVSSKIRSYQPKSRQILLAGQGFPLEYSFTVDGTVTGVTDEFFKSEGNDTISENPDGTVTVTGRTGCGSSSSCWHGDRFVVQGNITDMSLTPATGGRAAVMVDGVVMSPSEVVAEVTGEDDSQNGGGQNGGSNGGQNGGSNGDGGGGTLPLSGTEILIALLVAGGALYVL